MQKSKYDAEYYKQKNREAEEKVYDILKHYHENPEEIVEFFQFSSRFYSYSFNNNLLIYRQNPEASFVQSFNAWKEMGYSVKRGQHGLDIWVPVNITYIKDNDRWIKLRETDEEIKQAYKSGHLESRKILTFKLGKTYDISQTTCPLEHYPKFLKMGIASEKYADMIDCLVEYDKNHLNTDVIFDDLNSIYLKGYNVVGANRIYINNMFGDTEKLSTLIHETGHQILHQENQNNKNLSQIEFEADAFSILTHTYLGLNIEDSRKKHMTDNYKKMMEEYQKEHKGVDAKEIEYLGNVMKDVMQTAKTHVKNITEEFEKRKEKNKEKSKKVEFLVPKPKKEYYKSEDIEK